MCCGRQAGKSHMASAYAIVKCLSKREQLLWVISPSFRQSGFLFDKIVSFCNEFKIPTNIKKSQQEMSITFKLTGSVIQAVSGEDGDKLRGATLDGVIIDEAAMMRPNTFEEHIMPMLVVRKGEVMMLSTPKGKNWFYDWYASKDKDVQSFHYISTDNPYISPDELERARRNTDDLTFRQEYLGEFLDNGGEVFTHYAISDYPLGTHQDGHMYIAGLDLAKSVDYTVLTIADADTREIVDVMRMSDLSWESQVFKIKEYLKRFGNPIVYCDSTGLGDPIVERLVNEGVEARGLVFSSKSKEQMVQNLAVMLQNEEIKLPNIPEYISEFAQFTFVHSPTGRFKYSAPPGKHDDCVASMCLLAWGISQIASDVGPFFLETKQENSEDLEAFDWVQDDFDWSYD